MGIRLNVPLVGGLLTLTVLSAVASSIWPAWIAAKISIEPVLRQTNSRGGDRGHRHTRGLLVVTQIAMSLVLLIACGLLLRTIYKLRHVSLGFRTDHVIVADMTIPAYKFDGQNMTTELYQPLVERVQWLPGVQAAALTTAVPLGKRCPILFSLGGGEQGPGAARREDLVASSVPWAQACNVFSDFVC